MLHICMYCCPMPLSLSMGYHRVLYIFAAMRLST